jgi:endonuclease/exonuclease/phosphatase family metal-dependent hydrolase
MRPIRCSFIVLIGITLLSSTAALPAADPPTSAPAAISTAEAVPTIGWQDAGNYIGREVFVVGKIVQTGKARTGHVFLNFQKERGKFTAFIKKDVAANFTEPPEKALRGKTVKIRGFITEYKGAPEIAVSAPDKIEVVGEGTTAPASAPASQPASRPAVSDTITIGSFNVLNLFDAYDDPYANDEGTPAKPRAELVALARTIHTLNADVLALIEVENRGFLQQFVTVFLPDMGYEVVEYEGNDLRGIDVALLSRVPVGPVTSYRHLRFPDANGKSVGFQRDLLQVRLEPPAAKPFEVFVTHLKSKGGEDTGGLDIRMGETREARAILDGILKEHPDDEFVVCGDFNDYIDSEPVKTLIGSGPLALTTFISDLPPGENITYNQPPHLSMIDFILASPEMAKHYVPRSYHILTGGSPEKSGSDHNPVYAQFKLN